MDSTLTVLFQILQKITILLIPLVTKQLLDFAAQKNDFETFSKFGFAFLGLSLLSILFLSLRYYFQSKLEAEVTNDIKYAIGKKTFSIPYTDFLNKEPGYFVQRINRDTERLTGLIISDMSMFLINIVYACSIIFLMFDINFLISLILVLLFPLFLFVSKYFIPKIKKVNEMIMEQEEELNSHFNENINANYFIRVSNLDSHFNRKSELKLKEIYKTVLKKIRYEIRYDFFLVTGIMNLSHVLIYWLGGYLVFSDVMTFGSLTAISLYFSRLWSPIEFFMDFPKKIKEEEISLNRIRNLLDEPDTGDNIASSRSLSNPFEDITIRNLSFTHGEKKIFDNLSLKIKKGDKIGIIGDNGSGKTTLMNLLTIFTP